jgi:hypothetical protein
MESVNMRKASPRTAEPASPGGQEQREPTLAELRERAKKLDEEVRKHLEALSKMGKAGR